MGFTQYWKQVLKVVLKQDNKPPTFYQFCQRAKLKCRPRLGFNILCYNQYNR